MDYLITGGLGFIGSTFIKYLLNKDVDSRVIVLDSLTYAGSLENLQGFLNQDSIIYPQRHEELKNIVVHSNGSGLAKSIVGLAECDKRIEKKLANCIVRRPHDGNIADDINEIFGGPSYYGRGASRLAIVIGSVCDRSLVSNLLPMCDLVVNFAAETHVDRSIMNPDEFIKTDVYGTYVLLEAAKKQDTLKKFVHISTDEVYGVATEKSFSEIDPISPRNPYSASKAAADRLVYSYNQTYGLPINIVRPSNNFGPNQYPEKLIPVMIIKALNDERLPVYGDGKQIRDWLFVGDTVEAIDLIVHNGTIGEVYNIAGRNERENIMVIKEILTRLGKPETLINYVKDRPGHDRRYSLDDSKIRFQLGFKGSNSFESNLRDTIDWYVQNRKWWQKILDEDIEYRKFMEQWYKDRK